ncbi:MAG: DUF2332 domain-containing protein, partial [Terrimesophilobacter sp.]
MTERKTAEWYRLFGEIEARGQSALFEEWAIAIAEDPEVLALIEELPLQKRQPNLVFACARLLGAPESDYNVFRAWLRDHWPSVAAEAKQRMTQTNEPRRCAALLPALALIARLSDLPIALLELGASAGFCLYPDRYSYRFGGEWIDPTDGPSRVRIESESTGPVPVPSVLPDISWRAGIDLRPLDANDEADVNWLTTLVWPEQHERRERVAAAIEIVRQDPPLLLAGDAIERLGELVATSPPGATLVIVTSAMLVYLPYRERMRLVSAIRQCDAHWISLDGVGVLPHVDA